MARTTITDPNWSDAATLTASQEATDFPATNLQLMQPTDRWETNNLTSLYLELDRGSAMTWNQVALLFTNATSSATWRIRAATTQANLTASPSHDSTTITLWASTGLDTWDRRHGLYWLPAGHSSRWLRIDITDGSNPDTVFRAGRLYVANAWQMSRGRLFGDSALGWIDPSVRTVLPNGQIMVRRSSPRPLSRFTIVSTTESEFKNNADELDRLRGGSRDVLVVIDPGDSSYLHRNMIYGLQALEGSIFNPTAGVFEHQYTIEGLI